MRDSAVKKLAAAAAVFLLCLFIFLPPFKAHAHDEGRVVRISMADEYTHLPRPAKDPELARRMIDAVKKVPPWVLERMINLNVKLYLVDGPITRQPEYEYLKGVTPPSWEHTGYTWDFVPGIGGTNPAMVRMDYRSPDPERDIIYLGLHETGHMIDVFGRWGIRFSDDGDFIKAWEAERALFSANPYFDDRMEYFAEFFCEYHPVPGLWQKRRYAESL